ncbi:hypothetical protein OB2597_06115 [Pseudooceanicola batsensis HTCC2597]|uniref:3-dehydroquinate dehydratase n=1 Tax=Pseudooceanicola batsensis (strain ATCC BAA-863 / DSM 15984 / KCTC 12145 / HTCC2597) TaxID=252305 RepID=A3TT58_PSEBH|nr:DUF2478 domain-containing protein [Pseudooceanicola batsensis]EAQ04835.1 hypothetical protein OB2597_06115 [Pseudooceanicola batsensis HTCC2597]
MLGYIHTADRGVPNAVLAEVAAMLTAQGLCVTGLIQVRAPGEGAHPCDMDLKCLPDGPAFPIAQQLGRGSRGCRMDVAALETGVAYVEAQIAAGADVFILNKFGAQEAQGRGFRAAIGRALERGIPTLTVVNPLNLDAFRDFSDGLGEMVPAETEAILAWVAGARGAG